MLGQSTKVMIDSRAIGNFMDPRCQQKLGILGIEKPEPQPIASLNREPLGGFLETKLGTIPMAVMGHNKQINFNVTPLGQYDVVVTTRLSSQPLSF